MLKNREVSVFPAPNTRGRDWVVGDIHGAFSRLQSALNQIGFDPSHDRLFSVGDLVDKGPECEAFEDWLAQDWFFAVRGNHDQMAVEWARHGNDMDAGWYASQGGAWNIGALDQERVRRADLLASLPLAIQVQTHAGPVGIVHADCSFGAWAELVDRLSKPQSEQAFAHDRETTQWSRSRITHHDDSGVPDLRALIVGHTLVSSAAILGNVHYIETGGWLEYPLPDRGLHRPGFTFVDLATLEHVFVLSKD